MSEAQGFLEAALRQSPGHPRALLQLGHVRALAGDFESAERAYRSLFADVVGIPTMGGGATTARRL